MFSYGMMLFTRKEPVKIGDLAGEKEFEAWDGFKFGKFRVERDAIYSERWKYVQFLTSIDGVFLQYDELFCDTTQPFIMFDGKNLHVHELQKNFKLHDWVTPGKMNKRVVARVSTIPLLPGDSSKPKNFPVYKVISTDGNSKSIVVNNVYVGINGIDIKVLQ